MKKQRPSFFSVACIVLAVATIAMPVVYLTAGDDKIASEGNDQSELERHRAINEAMNELRSTGRDIYAQTDTLDEYFAQMRTALEQNADRVTRIATGNTPTDIIARAIARYTLENFQLDERYQRALVGSQESGAFDPARARSRDELASLIEQVRILYGLETERVDSFRQYPRTVVRDLVASGVDTKRAKAIASEIAGGPHFERQARILELERQATESILQTAELLDREWGQWSFGQNGVRFEDQELRRLYEAHSAELNNAVAEADRLSRGD